MKRKKKGTESPSRQICFVTLITTIRYTIHLCNTLFFESFGFFWEWFCQESNELHISWVLHVSKQASKQKRKLKPRNARVRTVPFVFPMHPGLSSPSNCSYVVWLADFQHIYLISRNHLTLNTTILIDI